MRLGVWGFMGGYRRRANTERERLPVVYRGDGRRIFAEFRATKVTILTGRTVGRTVRIADIVYIGDIMGYGL